MPTDQPPHPPAEAAYVAEPPLPRPAPPSATWRSSSRWALLDPYTARHASSLSFQLIGSRVLPERAPSSGYALALGESLTTVRGAFQAGALQEHELRWVPDDALTLTLSRYQWEAGPRLGLLEPRARVGFSLLHLGYGDDGFSFGMFSPRVGAGVWLALGSAHLGVSVFAEYFWRWVGDDSAFVRGLSFELQPGAAPLRRPRPAPPPPRRAGSL
ncbi:MAG TPA: hypothetical protein VEX18_12220 [Polyangiaceae bacterium]|nr:hypothetical protein [Polyangiaceae bacterium]